jgi:hypothetical protein
MDYINTRLKSMGVADSSIKSFNAKASPNRHRIWGNMLYTWFNVGDHQPAYFRKSYDMDWFDETGQTTERMFRMVVAQRPDVVDEYMRAIHDEYTKRGLYRDDPTFIDDLLKHFQRTQRK